MAELSGNLVSFFPSALERGLFFLKTARAVQFYSMPCYLLINTAKAQRIIMPLQFILHRNDQKSDSCLRKHSA